ncbi:MAG: alternative ribosome rescue aminoacyl-tRNA hydrolase ArfB [Acidimicrobiia bacterium]|nr:alternative ribosome rescue aminoacyl-tRNA hydrolase ArfB [Acidimicrobiia bacterium]
MDDVVVGNLKIPGGEIEEVFKTTGGPGGQHANRTRSQVRLRLRIDGSSLPSEVKARLVERFGEVVESQSSESRSQFRNRAIARRRLAEKISAALVDPTPRKPTKPTRAARRRRLRDKKARSELKRQRRSPEIE